MKTLTNYYKLLTSVLVASRESEPLIIKFTNSFLVEFSSSAVTLIISLALAPKAHGTDGVELCVIVMIYS